MINTFEKCRIGIVLLLFLVAFCGCSGDDDNESCDIPSGYYEIFRYSEEDYEEIRYEQGNHWIICTSYDNGKTWEQADIWL